MRYDKPIYFQTFTKGKYDPHTGNYAAKTTAEVECYASITDTGTDTLQLVYGELKQGCLTIRLQRPYSSAFDRIRIGDGEKAKFYRVDKSRLHNRVFIVSEVQ